MLHAWLLPSLQCLPNTLLCCLKPVCCHAVMNDIGTAPLQVVGYEGIFGCLAMFAVLLPIVQHTPGQDGSGLHEDSWETWHVRKPVICLAAAQNGLGLHCLFVTQTV